jgi:hypothetical protein
MHDELSNLEPIHVVKIRNDLRLCQGRFDADIELWTRISSTRCGVVSRQGRHTHQQAQVGLVGRLLEVQLVFEVRPARQRRRGLDAWLTDDVAGVGLARADKGVSLLGFPVVSNSRARKFKFV